MADDALILSARECMTASHEAMAHNRQEARADLDFKGGEQWTAEQRTSRGNERPTLTINKIPAFLHQIVNTYKQNRPGIAVAPVDSGGDKKTAEVIAGMLRHMFYVSQGDMALDVAFESAVDIGFGYFRLLTGYVDDHSFDQEILFAPIMDPFSVYFDPASILPDGSDAEECVIVSQVSRALLEQQYGGDVGLGFGGTDVVATAYATTDRAVIDIAEYFYTERVDDELWLLADGATRLRSEVQHGLVGEVRSQMVHKRPVTRKQIKWAKLTGSTILEESDWRGSYIPVVPIYGDRILVGHQWRTIGLIRWLRDPQFMLNYWESAKTEMLAMMPKSKWIGAAGQFEGYEEAWRTANTSNDATLEYNSRDADGNLVGQPQRQFPDPPPQGFIEASLHSAQHMKEISGIYDASLGNRSNETSGVAIAERQQQGDVANFHYFDNAMRSLRHAERIIVDLLPHIYDAPRMARILGEDRQAGLVPINQAIGTVLHDLTVGKYDVILSTGPSFQTRRQEAAARIGDLLRSWPALTDTHGDYLLQSLDWPGADGMATRWRMAKGVEQPEGTEVDAAQQLQQMQQQMQRMQQEAQALNAYAQQQEQECTRLQQEHAAMQQDKTLEARKLDLDEEKVRLDAQIKAQQLALDAQRVAMEANAQGMSPAEISEGLGLIVQGVQEQIEALRVLVMDNDREPSRLAGTDEAAYPSAL